MPPPSQPQISEILILTPNGKWCPISPDDLSKEDEAGTLLCLRYDNGTTSTEFAWADWKNSDGFHNLATSFARQQTHRKYTSATATEKQAKTSLATNVKHIAHNTEHTAALLRFTCRFLIVFLCLNFVIAGLFLGLIWHSRTPLGGIIGIGISILVLILVRLIVTLWENRDDNSGNDNSADE